MGVPILYGIALRPDYEPTVQNRHLVVGEQVSESFAIRPMFDCWRVDHLPTGYSLGTSWNSRRLAIEAARKLDESGHMQTECATDYDEWESDPDLVPAWSLARKLYFDDDATEEDLF